MTGLRYGPEGIVFTADPSLVTGMAGSPRQLVSSESGRAEKGGRNSLKTHVRC